MHISTALWGLIFTPHLLHLLVLHWSVLGIPLGPSIGIVTNLSTLEASVVHLSTRGVGLHLGARRCVLAVLLKVGARSLLSGVLELLSRALELTLPKTPAWALGADWCPLLWSEVRAGVAPRLSLRDGLPL